MIFSTETNYWLASRYAYCDTLSANLGLHCVDLDYLGGHATFISSTAPVEQALRLRPVVTLGSNIKISTTGGTADSPRTISL